MAVLKRAEKMRILEDIANDAQWAMGFILSDNPSSYPDPDARWLQHIMVDQTVNKLREPIAKELELNTRMITSLAYGQLIRSEAHRLLDHRFPLEESQEYERASDEIGLSLENLGRAIVDTKRALYIHLSDRGADSSTLRMLDVKAPFSYISLKSKGTSHEEAIETIRQSPLSMNTAYPTIDDIERGWNDLQSKMNDMEKGSKSAEAVEKFAIAAHDYLDTAVRLHTFLKY